MKKYVDKKVFLKSLRRRQKAMKYDDKTLSMKAGLNPTAIRDIFKKQKTMPRFDTIATLADTLCCTTEQLVYDIRTSESDLPGKKISARTYLEIIQHALEFRNTDYSDQEILEASRRVLTALHSVPDLTSRDIEMIFRSMNLVKKSN